jgi:hypothetical protein
MLERKLPINTSVGRAEDDVSIIKIRAEQRKKEKELENMHLEQIEVSFLLLNTIRCGSVSSSLCARCNWLKIT